MKVIPFDSHRSTNFAFSDKNPYPGWTACYVTDMQGGELDLYWIVMDCSIEERYSNAGTLSYRSIILSADFHIDEVGISQTV